MQQKMELVPGHGSPRGEVQAHLIAASFSPGPRQYARAQGHFTPEVTPRGEVQRSPRGENKDQIPENQTVNLTPRLNLGNLNQEQAFAPQPTSKPSSTIGFSSNLLIPRQISIAPQQSQNFQSFDDPSLLQNSALDRPNGLTVNRKSTRVAGYTTAGNVGDTVPIIPQVDFRDPLTNPLGSFQNNLGTLGAGCPVERLSDSMLSPRNRGNKMMGDGPRLMNLEERGFKVGDFGS